MNKKILASATLVLAGLAAEASLVRLVPESGASKLFTMKTEGEREYRVRFYRPDVFRVEAAPRTWVTEGTNLVARYDYADTLNNPTNAQILVDGYAEDKTGVKFADKDGKFVFSTSAIVVSFDKTNETMSVTDWRGSPMFREAAPLSLTTNACAQTIVSDASERIYGGGQQVGYLMHKGRRIRIDCDFNWSEGGVPNPAPFVISSRGYGILRHTFAAGEYDFTSEAINVLRHAEGRFDAFYFCGGDFPSVIDRYTEATGRPNFIPMWGLELGDADAYMTREKETKLPKQEEDGSFTETTPDVVRRVAMPYRENDMPCGWLLVNDGYGCGHVQLASVADSLAQLGFKTGLWTDGALDLTSWEVGTAGTRIQKLDVAWTCRGGKYKAQHALQCNKDAYLGITTNSNARAFCWTVLGWAGTQRYGICWAGDEYGGWDLVRYMIPTVTGSAMSAQTYATTDVDGIFGGSNETYLRDLQWKCWTTAMYVMNGWSHVNKSPWTLPEPYRSLCRDALKRKIRLTPFFYTLMRESWETGAPIVRPMVWNYPDDPETWSEKTKYQFMVGDDVLVAPVYTAEKFNKGWWRKGIYLPEGDWYDYNDGRRVAGGQWLKAYPVDLTKIPVFVRAGTILAMYDESLTTVDADRTRLTFDVWPGPFAETVRVYEDDGETLDYARGDYSDTLVMMTPSSETSAGGGEVSDFDLQIIPTYRSAYAGRPEKRVYAFDVHTQVEPAMVLANGTEVLRLSTTNDVKALFANVKQGWYYDPEEKFGTLHVKLLPREEAAELALAVRFQNPVVARLATPAYPVPTEAEDAAAAEAEKRPLTEMVGANEKKMVDGADVVVPAKWKFQVVGLDGSYRRIVGHVATHPDNSPEARFTFRITAGKKTLFERANMKGEDVPQLIAVDIPADTGSISFDFTPDNEDDASVSAKGVWKGVEFVAE